MPFFEKGITNLQISMHLAGNDIMPTMNYHDAYEIYILEAGDRSFMVEDKLISMKPCDVLLLKKNEIHCTISGTFVRSRIEFTDEYLLKYFSAHGLELVTECFAKSIIRIRESDFTLLLSLLEKLSENTDDVLTLTHIFIILKNNMSRSTYGLQNINSKIADIVDYITENYRSIDNLDMIANKFYINKHYLCNLFKECTGTTIIKYINILKIQASFEFIASQSLTIAEIAEKSGFNSIQYFSQTFKSVTGVSPLKYRQKIMADIQKKQ